MENYKSNLTKIGEKFGLDEKKIRLVIKKGLNRGMFDNIARESGDNQFCKQSIKRAVTNNYDLSDKKVALKVQEILDPYFQSLQNGEQISINTVAKQYGMQIKELREFLGYQSPLPSTEIPNTRINKSEQARWIVMNPFLAKPEEPALVTACIPEIISAFLKNYLLNAGNKKQILQLFETPIDRQAPSISDANNVREVPSINSLYLFDKISFSKNAMNRFSKINGRKDKQADKKANGQIIGFFKNHLSKKVDIIATTQQGVLVLVQSRDNPELLRKWRSDAMIREFQDEEKMFVLDIPIKVEVGRDDERPTKKTKSDNTIDLIPQLGRSNEASVYMSNTLQLLLFELFVTYHDKHHDDSLPLYVKYSDVTTIAAPNAHKFMIQLGIPPISLHSPSEVFESIRMHAATGAKQKKYPKQLIGNLDDAEMEKAFRKIMHRNSFIKKGKQQYKLNTRNVYLRFLGFIDNELLESTGTTLDNMPGIADFSAATRYFRDRDDCISKRKDSQEAKIRSLLQLPENVKVSEYLQDLEKQYEDLIDSYRKNYSEMERKAQEIWTKAEAVFIAMDQDPDTGNGGNGREMAGLRGDIRESCALYPSSRAETLVGLGYKFLLQMYISQQQHDKYLGATSDFIQKSLEQGSYFF